MTINFLKGHPTLDLLPQEDIASAYEKVLRENSYKSYESDPNNQHPLSYGTDPGNLDCRKTIAKWNDTVFKRLDKPTDPNTLNLTGGASYGVANILSSLTSVVTGVTKRAFVVTPCYYLINGAFIDAGFEGKLTAIDETHDGEYEIDLQHLEKELYKYSQGLEPADQGHSINVREDPLGRGSSKKYRFVIYIVPTFSNPGGLTYSVKTRTRLLEIARKFDMLIISDDVYELLDYSDDKEKALVPRVVYLDRDTLPSWDEYGHSITNATFSKIIAPGLRCGWQESATPRLAKQLAVSGANKSGGTPGQLASFVVTELIRSGKISKIVNNFNSVYAKRAAVLKSSVSKYLPPSTKLYGGDGGYFFWVDLNKPELDHRPIIEKLNKENDIILSSGDNFEVFGDERDWGRNCVRLSISLLSEDEIEKGIQAWGKLLQKEFN